MRCDSASAELNFLNVHWKKNEPDRFNGNRKFSFEIFKNVSLFLVKFTDVSMLYLNKFHFYVDFLHFKKYGISLTGAQYAMLKYGPCPDQYKPIYDVLVNKGYLKIKTGNSHSYELGCEPDLSLFDDREKKTLECIVALYEKLGAQEIYRLAHKERGYVETEECSFIDYKFAEFLQLPDQAG